VIVTLPPWEIVRRRLPRSAFFTRAAEWPHAVGGGGGGGGVGGGVVLTTDQPDQAPLSSSFIATSLPMRANSAYWSRPRTTAAGPDETGVGSTRLHALQPVASRHEMRWIAASNPSAAAVAILGMPVLDTTPREE
jgi:hypothetical protein